MRRSTFDDSKDEKSGQPLDFGTLPCSYCRRPTPKLTLSAYGSRCFACFEEYTGLGIKGAAPGFMTGARDTPTQKDMRKRLFANRPTGVVNLNTEAEEVAKAREAAKAETARRVAQYHRENQ